jgi:hypothetical protein
MKLGCTAPKLLFLSQLFGKRSLAESDLLVFCDILIFTSLLSHIITFLSCLNAIKFVRINYLGDGADVGLENTLWAARSYP